MAIGTKQLAPSELDTFEDQRLVEELRKAKEELFNLRFQSATGQLESHGRIRAVKRDIARLYTVIRERELGIRAALGAAPTDLRRLVYRRSFAIAGAGLGVGTALALALGRMLAAIEYGVDAIDPLTWAAAISLVVGAAMLATIRPGLIAMRVDPLTLLKRE